MKSLSVLLASLALCPTAFASTCKPIQKVEFKAVFSTQNDKRLQLKVGAQTRSVETGLRPVSRYDAEPIAQIWSEDRCVAVCTTRFFDQYSSFLPIALALDCKATAFSPAAVPATVIWPEAARPQAMLRLGSWVTGYQDLALSVQVDRYSARVRQAPKIASRLGYVQNRNLKK